MNVATLAALIEGKSLNGLGEELEVDFGYSCDLLSWVMARGQKGTAWVTVQTHQNVVAVATLLEFACIIVPEGIEVEADIVDKASEEDIALISTPLTAYEVCGRMAAAGIASAGKG